METVPEATEIDAADPADVVSITWRFPAVPDHTNPAADVTVCVVPAVRRTFLTALVSSVQVANVLLCWTVKRPDPVPPNVTALNVFPPPRNVLPDAVALLRTIVEVSAFKVSEASLQFQTLFMPVNVIVLAPRVMVLEADPALDMLNTVTAYPAVFNVPRDIEKLPVVVTAPFSVTAVPSALDVPIEMLEAHVPTERFAVPIPSFLMRIEADEDVAVELSRFNDLTISGV
jgi:hypothetical protein